MSTADSGLPGHRPAGSTPLPAGELAELQAWQASDGYPGFAYGGGALFGIARERDDGRWELLAGFGADFPQAARDDFAAWLRTLAAGGQQAPARQQDAAGERERAARLLDRQALDEVTVAGQRYRVARAQPFIRTGPAGPEPPRPADPDVAPGAPAASSEAADPAAGFVLAAAPAGTAAAALTSQLLAVRRPAGPVPLQVREQEEQAAARYPGGVLLPAAFTIARLAGAGGWQPLGRGTQPAPQLCRTQLCRHLRVFLPWQRQLDSAQQAPYEAAAQRVEEGRLNEVAAGGERFRVVRVERLIRLGPDGPEGPRPSDPDPYPPVLAGYGLEEDPADDEGYGYDDEDGDAGDGEQELAGEERRLHELTERERARRADGEGR